MIRWIDGRPWSRCASCGDQVEGEPCTRPAADGYDAPLQSAVLFSCDGCGREWEIDNADGVRVIARGTGNLASKLSDPRSTNGG